MNAQFINGPYDGFIVDNNTINRCCTLYPITDATPPRLFVLMPPVHDWERLVSGEISKDETSGGSLHAYERFFNAGNVEFHDADANGSFEAALRGEHPAPEDVFGSHEDALAYKLECRLAQVLGDVVHTVVPPGTLGGGMSLSQTTHTNRDCDKENDEITITGIVKITVSRTKESINAQS